MKGLIIGLMMPLFSWAADKTAQLNVAATLSKSCVTHASTDISFGTLNFGRQTSLSQPITVMGQKNAGAIDIKCNKGVTYQILLDGGRSGNPQARTLYNPTTQQTITYNLYTDANYQTLWDNQQGVSQIANGEENIIAIYGKIPAQTTPFAGIYSDTVIATVNW